MRRIAVILMLLCATALAAQNYIYDEFRAFKGMLNGKTAFELIFQKSSQNGESRCAGYIYYPNAKNPAPILIVGRYLKSDPKDPNSEYLYHMAFEEYQPDGEMTGKIDLEYYEVEGDYTFKKGTWINPNNARRLPMTQTKSVFEKASWWPGAPSTLTAPKREAYSYKYAFTKDNDGWLQDITVDLYADGKKVAPEIRESYSYPFKEDQHLDWITETDINFDGIPDLYLFTGFHSHAQSAYAAYVWNPATLQFYRVDTFDEIAEPEFDEKAKTITSRARDNGHMYIDVFKWKNGKLSRISSKKQSLFD